MFQKLPEIIIFDWDNTLVTQNGLIEFVQKKTLEEFNITNNSFVGNNYSPKDVFKNIFGKKKEEAKDFFYKTFKREHINKLEIKEVAKKLLDFILEKEIIMFIVSSKSNNLLQKEVEHLNLGKYFKSIIGSGSRGKNKPDFQFVKYAFENAKIEMKNNGWVIGDSKVDVLMAKNANYEAMIIPSNEDKLKYANIDYKFQKFKNLTEILDFTKGLEK